MQNLKVYCTSINYYKVLDKLPSYISIIGLGKERFPKNWLKEVDGKNILEKNSFYGELTGIYWIWKNLLKNFDKNDLIGNCHYRKLWLNSCYPVKQKNSKQSLFQNLLNEKNKILNNEKNFQIQPIKKKKKNLLEDFEIIHKNDSLEKSILFLDKQFQEPFKAHLKEKIFYPLNMFITTPDLFEKYCETIFPWLEKCFQYCQNNNLCRDYNLRLPAFLAERFTSFWFSQYSSYHLSYARLGNFFLSNTINSVLNPIKIPYTFKMYPTLHDY